MLSKEQLVSVARSMAPIAASQIATPVVPSNAQVDTSDQAIAQARSLLGSIGGNRQATASHVTLTVLSTEIWIGMPAPNGVDPSTSVWEVQFADGMAPANCQQTPTSASLCEHGEITVIVDAESGSVLGYHGFDGVWKQP